MTSGVRTWPLRHNGDQKIEINLNAWARFIDPQRNLRYSESSVLGSTPRNYKEGSETIW